MLHMGDVGNYSAESLRIMAKQKKEQKGERPSLRTIAEHINLSPATISLALRGDTSIPPETRERVITAAEDLNYEYVPRVKKSEKIQLRRLAFVMHDYGDNPVTANPFYSHILSGAEQACRQQQVSLSFVVLQHDHPVTEELPPVLTHDVEGILLPSPYPLPLIKRLNRESDCSIVLIDNIFPESPYDAIMADDFGGAYQAVRFLIQSGHKHILMLTGRVPHSKVVPSFEARCQGYRTACSEADISPLTPVASPLNTILYSGEELECFKKWLKGVLERVPQLTAFFCVTDFHAVNVINALGSIGYRVPEDISVVGFDDLNFASIHQPPLTTIHSFKESMAHVAVERLLARLEGDDSPPQYIYLGTELIVRNSTGPPSARQ